MESWKELLGMVELWMARMPDDEPPCEPTDGSSYYESIVRLLEDTESAVTTACDELAMKETLPSLSRAEEFHMWARLDYAREILLSMQSAPFGMPKTDQTLRWLLFGAWRYGRQRFLQRLRDVSDSTMPPDA